MLSVFNILNAIFKREAGFMGLVNFSFQSKNDYVQ